MMQTLRNLGTYPQGEQSSAEEQAQSLINTEMTRISSMPEGIDKLAQRAILSAAILAGHYLPGAKHYERQLRINRAAGAAARVRHLDLTPEQVAQVITDVILGEVEVTVYLPARVSEISIDFNWEDVEYA